MPVLSAPAEKTNQNAALHPKTQNSISKHIYCILGRNYGAEPPAVSEYKKHYISPDRHCQAKPVRDRFFVVLRGDVPQKGYISLAPLTFTPGPMVEATTQLLIYWPLAAAGLALMIAPIRAVKFSVSFSAPKETLPMGQWMMLVLSRRYSTLPALISVMALATSGVTVPALGEGIRPLGPRTLPRRPTTPIISGVATTTS